MKKIFTITALIAVLATLLLNAWKYPVYAIGPMQVTAGLRMVINNQPGTFVMESEKLAMLAWQRGDVNYFIILSKATAAPVEDFFQASGEGQLVSIRCMNELKTYLLEHGWKFVSIGELSQVVFNSIYSAVYMTSLGFPTIYVFPIMPDILIRPAMVKT